MMQRFIPSSGQALPVLGIGTWKCFDVTDASRYVELMSVLRAMVLQGGSLIDTSPMYGRAESVIGDVTGNLEERDHFFYATKVWTTGRAEGIAQMESSLKRMKRASIDLMQIHNLTDWKTHLPVLREWKAESKIKYIGITHYRDDMHAELERILLTEKDIDFVQFNYSIEARHAEKRLLKAAADLGVATLINRPFGEGALFRRVYGKSLPHWAADLGIHTWSSFFLQFILSHPEVTCVIPATSNPLHAVENFVQIHVKLPGSTERQRMIDYLEQL